ncbi:MAG: hypothetical protein JW838_13205 [Spirochaetes bacterium]|nr:hypothetical protein [Spirochaetota bacterium]
MDKKIIETTTADIRRFCAFSDEMSDAVARIVADAADMKKFIDLAGELGEKFTLKCELSLSGDLMLRDQLNTMHNACSFLDSNIARQKEVIAGLQASGGIDPGAEKRLRYRILMLSDSIQNALGLIRRILDRHNRVILINKLIGRRLEGTREFLKRLGEGGRRIVEAAAGLNAFASTSGCGPGDDLPLRTARALEAEDAAGIARIADEIMKGLQAEESAMAAVAAVTPVLEELSGAAAEARIDSGDTQKTIDEKCGQNRRNLDEMRQLSVVLSVEIDEYKKVKDTIGRDRKGEALPAETRVLFNELSILYTTAVDAIENLAELNAYTMELFKTNGMREDQVMEIWNMFRRCHDTIRKQGEETAAHLNAITEGLGRNGIIGQVVEKNLRKLT